ncbi:NTP transferase domain-containing protein [Pokkaliibacter sp. CJK22405]|uniref:nucleotidyltransferase family protein n=1 Tax=Pokkaliibacter sp. CJK22405 TaxID=3384615 RepID=UPI003984D282
MQQRQKRRGRINMGEPAVLETQTPTSFRIAALVLAAGEARRFGQPKQLLTLSSQPAHNGPTSSQPVSTTTSLVRHSVNQLQPLFPRSDCLVITGAYHEEVKNAVDEVATTLHHANWQEGLGSSLAAGVKALNEQAPWDGILVALADQPLLTTEDYRRLLYAFDGKRCVNAFYRDDSGVPAIFPAFCFEGLAELEGDKGAKALLKAQSNRLELSLPQAAMDIDTPEDWRAFHQGL